MHITMTLNVPEEGDWDPAHSMGLTTAAYDRLYEAVTDAGFEFVEGPDKVEE